MVGQVMRVSAIRLATTLGLFFLVAGCTVDVVDPDSGQYQCETPADCSDGYYCSDAGYCLSKDTPDPK